MDEPAYEVGSALQAVPPEVVDRMGRGLALVGLLGERGAAFVLGAPRGLPHKLERAVRWVPLSQGGAAWVP